MKASRHLFALALALSVTSSLTTSSRDARAQATPEDDAKKAEAKRHFDRGVSLSNENAWGPAYAEFQASRSLFPTRGAEKNAAIASGHRLGHGSSLGCVPGESVLKMKMNKSVFCTPPCFPLCSAPFEA